LIKYIGSKRALLPTIVRTIQSIQNASTVLDLFSGTCRVGHALKARGYRVLSNDHNAYAHVLARCYVQADREDIEEDARRLIGELSTLPGRPGYFTHTFCEQSRFFHPKNGERIDAIREAIATKSLPPELEAVLLTSLMEAADRVDSTTGLQMAYLKSWAPRAHNDLELRLPHLLDRAPSGKGEAFCLDAFQAVTALSGDIAYVDPPYNQHSYLRNYHVWESLVVWDKPEVYGTACKRVDCRTRRSVFNSRPRFRAAFSRLIESIQAPALVVSFNNEGYLSRAEIEAILSRRGCVTVVESDYSRYVGAKIGIHNPRGQKVGKVSHVSNKEYLFVVAQEPVSVAAGQALPAPAPRQLQLFA
jgi:adenine-specific DNA-methyltransferase